MTQAEKKVIEAARRFYMLESAANKKGLRVAVREMIDGERIIESNLNYCKQLLKKYEDKVENENT